jgi:3-oxoacyl-[acyl-carrier-protein] synthase-3
MDRRAVTSDVLFVHGLGHYHPETCIDNAFLESLDIGTSDQWILRRVGIRTRFSALPRDYIQTTRNRDPREAETAASCDGVEMAVRAARLALERAGLTAADISLVVAGTSAPAFGAPAVASIVAARLGIGAASFDMNAACTSFALHARMLSSLDVNGFVLSVYPENLTKVVDYRDRNTAVLMGDAAAACIWSKTEPSRVLLTEAAFGSDPHAWGKVSIPSAGHLQLDGQAVQAFAVKTMAMMVRQRRREPDTFVGHQANLRMLQSVCEHACVPAARHVWNVDARGNCGAAGAPSVLSEHWERLVHSGDALIVALVGAGLSWGGLRMQFC